MRVQIKCNNCGATCWTVGTEDWQSVGDGGPACSTGIEVNPDGEPESWDCFEEGSMVCLHTEYDVIQCEPEDYSEDWRGQDY